MSGTKKALKILISSLNSNLLSIDYAPGSGPDAAGTQVYKPVWLLLLENSKLIILPTENGYQW